MSSSHITQSHSPSTLLQRSPLLRAIGYALIPTLFYFAGILQFFFGVIRFWIPSMRFNLFWQALAGLVALGLLSKQRQKELDETDVVMRSKAEQKSLLSPKITLGFLPLVIIIAACLYFSISVFINGDIGSIVSIVLHALLAAIAGEVFFRGVIFEFLQEKGFTYGLFVSSLLYAFSNALFYIGVFSLPQLLFQLLFLFVFAITAGLICFTTGRLWLAVVWNFLFNLPLFAGFNLNPFYLAWMALYTAAMVLYSAYLFYQLNKAQKQWPVSLEDSPL